VLIRYRKKYTEIQTLTHCLNIFFSAIIKSIIFQEAIKLKIIFRSIVLYTIFHQAGLKEFNAKGKGGSMGVKTIIAIILIAVGIVALAYQGISYTTREKVVDLGPIHMTADKTRSIPLPPIVGAIALVGGIVILVTGKKKD
jgi:hypothetical protein